MTVMIRWLCDVFAYSDAEGARLMQAAMAPNRKVFCWLTVRNRSLFI